MVSSPFALLPEGLRDRLPPQAEAAMRLKHRLLAMFQSYGYRLVAPPLAEFQTTLSRSDDRRSDRDLLRFIDPESGRTLAFRPDMTRQVGRIATNLLQAAPRPLRLCYAGQVVRLNSGRIRPDREMLQIGAELIGNDSCQAAREIVILAITALEAAGLGPITVDFTLPDAIAALSRGPLPLAPRMRDSVQAALDAKDAGALVQLEAEGYLPLLRATGDFAEAVSALRAFDHRGVLAPSLNALEVIASYVGDRARLTLDATERHGFAYQSWFGFSLFVADHSEAIGRGGAYNMRAFSDPGRVQGSDTEQDSVGGETAVGFSIYPDSLIDAGLGGVLAVENERMRRLFLPMNYDPVRATALRSEGWTTIAALDSSADGWTLGCGFWLGEDGPQPYDDK